MRVREITPAADTDVLLTGAQFADAFCIEIGDRELDARRAAEGMMARNPASSVMIGFGVGFGLGLVLTTLLSRPEETWADRYLPDRLRNAPDSLHHLADSLRGLPDAIARRIPSQMRNG